MAWKKALIRPSTSLREAIKTIDEGAMQIALVVDRQMRLLGTITDGDVRRAILKGHSLDEASEKIMMRQPIVVGTTESPDAILRLMKEKLVRQIPVLDEKGRIDRVEILDELMEGDHKDNWVLLMAGGFGRRLMPLTKDCPKPLLKVGDRPILETILNNFIDYGFKNFFIAVHYKDDMVRKHFGDGKKWGVQIKYLRENTQLGTAGALGLLPGVPTKPMIVMNGDLLTKVNFQQLLEFHRSHRAQATMCVRQYDFQVPYGVVELNTHHISQIHEKPLHKFFVNAGIYVLDPGVVKIIPKNKHLDMPALFHTLIRKKKSVCAFPIREYWVDIGRFDELERAEKDFSRIFQ